MKKKIHTKIKKQLTLKLKIEKIYSGYKKIGSKEGIIGGSDGKSNWGWGGGGFADGGGFSDGGVVLPQSLLCPKNRGKKRNISGKIKKKKKNR